jgi:putative ATP-binding cassette transporter
MTGLGTFLRHAWRLSLPYFRSEDRWPARGLLLAVLVLNLALVGVDVALSYWNNAFYNSLQDKDLGAFFALLTWGHHDKDGTLLPGFCLLAGLSVALSVYSVYLNQWLQIRWRRWMTERFLAEWLEHRAYWRIALAAQAGSATDNPDQRIAEDVRDFVASALALSVDFVSNLVSLGSFVAILWSLSGPLVLWGINVPGYMVWLALIYAVGGTVAAHLAGRRLAALNFRQQRVEADFRFALVRFRENAEGVALYSGEAEEHRTLAARFAEVAGNWWAIMRQRKLLSAVTSGYNQAAVVFPVLIAAPRFFSGEIQLGGLTQTATAFGQVQSALSWFVNSYVSLASWRATVERLAQFHLAVLAAHAAQRGEHPQGVAVRPSNGPDWMLHDVTLALPDGRILTETPTLALHAGESVVVTGRSGTGKSTLFRALAGIWPFGRGEVLRPQGRVMFLPQRAYLPLGTLRHALCYPDAVHTYTDEAIRAALEAAGLSALAARLDDDTNWSQSLSGGEQQRVALARALLARPDWLFLDEATASLDPESEAEFYATLRSALPQTTIVSIAHRPDVAALHTRRLTMVAERPIDG